MYKFSSVSSQFMCKIKVRSTMYIAAPVFPRQWGKPLPLKETLQIQHAKCTHLYMQLLCPSNVIDYNTCDSFHAHKTSLHDQANVSFWEELCFLLTLNPHVLQCSWAHFNSQGLFSVVDNNLLCHFNKFYFIVLERLLSHKGLCIIHWCKFYKHRSFEYTVHILSHEDESHL